MHESTSQGAALGCCLVWLRYFKLITIKHTVMTSVMQGTGAKNKKEAPSKTEDELTHPPSNLHPTRYPASSLPSTLARHSCKTARPQSAPRKKTGERQATNRKREKRAKRQGNIFKVAERAGRAPHCQTSWYTCNRQAHAQAEASCCSRLARAAAGSTASAERKKKQRAKPKSIQM